MSAVFGGGGDGPGAGCFVAGGGTAWRGSREDVAGVVVGRVDAGGAGLLLDHDAHFLGVALGGGLDEFLDRAGCSSFADDVGDVVKCLWRGGS